MNIWPLMPLGTDQQGDAAARRSLRHGGSRQEEKREEETEPRFHGARRATMCCSNSHLEAEQCGSQQLQVCSNRPRPARQGATTWRWSVSSLGRNDNCPPAVRQRHKPDCGGLALQSAGCCRIATPTGIVPVSQAFSRLRPFGAGCPNYSERHSWDTGVYQTFRWGVPC